MFYVAATRAREKLYILNYNAKSCSEQKNTPMNPSIFIEELQGKLQREQEKRIRVQKNAVKALKRLFRNLKKVN